MDFIDNDVSRILIWEIFCFSFAVSLNIFIIASYDMEVGLGKTPSYSSYTEIFQINQCGMLRLSIRWIRVVVLFLQIYIFSECV
jgi:hypothetical protein